MSVINRFNNWYVSGAQAHIYIGNYFVGNALNIQYEFITYPQPIYSAFDVLYRAVAPGQAIVNGRLITAYHSEGYMDALIKKYEELSKRSHSLNKNNNGHGANRDQFNILSDVEQHGDGTGLFAINGSQFPTPNGNNVIFEDYANQMRNKYWGASTFSGNSLPPLYKTPFKIIVRFGEQEGAKDEEVIFDAIIGSKNKIFDNTGAPVKEIYDFIGRILI